MAWTTIREIHEVRDIANARVPSGTVRLPAFTKHTKRSRAATCIGDYCTEVAAHAPEARLEGKSLGIL